MAASSYCFGIPEGQVRSLEDVMISGPRVLYVRDCTLTPKLCKRRDRRVWLIHVNGHV